MGCVAELLRPPEIKSIFVNIPAPCPPMVQHQRLHPLEGCEERLGAARAERGDDEALGLGDGDVARLHQHAPVLLVRAEHQRRGHALLQQRRQDASVQTHLR